MEFEHDGSIYMVTHELIRYAFIAVMILFSLFSRYNIYFNKYRYELCRILTIVYSFKYYLETSILITRKANAHAMYQMVPIKERTDIFTLHPCLYHRH